VSLAHREVAVCPSARRTKDICRMQVAALTDQEARLESTLTRAASGSAAAVMNAGRRGLQ
jgi:hypothetical protein